jgi:hypothetical protein
MFSFMRVLCRAIGWWYSSNGAGNSSGQIGNCLYDPCSGSSVRVVCSSSSPYPSHDYIASSLEIVVDGALVSACLVVLGYGLCHGVPARACRCSQSPLLPKFSTAYLFSFSAPCS